MKPFLCALLALAILCLAGTPWLPAAAAMTEPGSEEMEVYVRTDIVLPSNYYEAAQEEGAYTVTAGDGTVITVKPEAPSAGLQLVVYQITAGDAQAYSWFESSAEGLGGDRRYYAVCFLDGEGRQVDGGSCTVTVRLPADTGKIRADRLATDGSLTALPSSTTGRDVTFPMTGNGYYVLSAPKTGGGQETPSNPSTGDGSGVLAWFQVMLLSAAACLLLMERRNKKRHR